MKLFYQIAAVVFLSGCTRMDLTPVNYVKWMEDESNGLRQSKMIDQLEFQVQLKTNEYVLLKEENIIPAGRKDEFEKEKKELGEMRYFTFKIKTPDGTDPLKFRLADKEEYYARVKYYSFDVQNDFQLVEGKDTLSCSLAHFERNFGIAPEITCLLGFPPARSEAMQQENKSFVYYDRVFNSGRLIFSFSKENINHIPKLKS